MTSEKDYSMYLAPTTYHSDRFLPRLMPVIVFPWNTNMSRESTNHMSPTALHWNLHKEHISCITFFSDIQNVVDISEKVDLSSVPHHRCYPIALFRYFSTKNIAEIRYSASYNDNSTITCIALSTTCFHTQFLLEVQCNKMLHISAHVLTYSFKAWLLEMRKHSYHNGHTVISHTDHILIIRRNAEIVNG